ncbi:putative ABC transport system ATP-binding protein [Actinopolymorpha cephalotaxi]|uniref:ABC transport system ATP-binding protein n=1 Tax=Actinopolymorpha cephalotaxi TaxID=504797 RepID=A0A1I3BW98_9ACTN|nr:ABC transporter ATP-binding protein [Actinopolymorpha cephalotaxi]NYH86324.1 putative ABC transport system ATP-binding protein [Actinopolymorpha cephalotaxi]SFH66628.1 putative ABC transport system ATP-binding protein [Actinopolymorpha cephalotaxi]
MNSSRELLGASGLRLSFGLTTALDGASIVVQPGEIVALMGPSGAGKSTLLHCLAGILRPDDGEVWFDGERLDTMSDRARSAHRLRRFGFVFQFGDLVPELTLRENVLLPLRLLRAGSDALDRAAELLDTLEIDRVADRLAAEVAGGEAQRAAVARALAHQPAVIFADEPTGALDSVSGEVVLSTLIRLARQHGSSVILVTHDNRVAAHADREVVMRDGRLAAGVAA